MCGSPTLFLLPAYLERQRDAHLALTGIAQEPKRHAERVLHRVAGRMIDGVAYDRAQLDEQLGIDVAGRLRVDAQLDLLRAPAARFAAREFRRHAQEVAAP